MPLKRLNLGRQCLIAEPDETNAKREQRRNLRLLSRNYESCDSIDEPYKKFRTQYAQRLHNTFATMQIKLKFTT